MRLLSVLAISLTSACALAQGTRPGFPVVIGNVTIVLAAPQGFARVTSAQPELAQLGEKFTPQTNRLLAHFVRMSDLGPKTSPRKVVFDRYFLVQTAAANESKKLDEAAFAQIRRLFSNYQIDLRKALDPSLAKLLPIDKVGAQQRKLLDQLKPGQFVPLGVFADSDSAVTGGTLRRLDYKEEGGYEANHLMVTATSVVAVRERSILLYVYSGFRGGEDVRWARDASLAWIEALRALNK